jgi:hypothetical protein
LFAELSILSLISKQEFRNESFDCPMRTDGRCRAATFAVIAQHAGLRVTT